MKLIWKSSHAWVGKFSCWDQQLWTYQYFSFAMQCIKHKPRKIYVSLEFKMTYTPDLPLQNLWGFILFYFLYSNWLMLIVDVKYLWTKCKVSTIFLITLVDYKKRKSIISHSRTSKKWSILLKSLHHRDFLEYSDPILQR